MEKLLEKVDGLQNLSLEERVALQDEIKEAASKLFNDLDESNPDGELVAEITKLSEAGKLVKAGIDEAEAKQVELLAAVNDAKALFSFDKDKAETDDETKEEGEAIEAEPKDLPTSEDEDGQKGEASVDETSPTQSIEPEAPVEEVIDAVEEPVVETIEEVIEEVPDAEASAQEPKEDKIPEDDEDEEDKESSDFSSKPVGTTQITGKSDAKEALDKASKGDEDAVKDLDKQAKGEVDKTTEPTKDLAIEVKTNPGEDAEDTIASEPENTVVTKKLSEKELSPNKSSKKEEAELAIHDDSAVEAVENTRPQVTITAGADLGRGYSVGQELSSVADVAIGIINKTHAMGNTSGGDGEKHTVATFSLNDGVIPQLDPNNIVANTSLFEKASRGQEVITASGGLYGPVETKYDLTPLGETIRPVRDALPKFGADRGGVRYTLAPTLASVSAAVSLWTLEDDKAAQVGQTTKVKPTLIVKAGEEVTVYVDAIPLSLTFSNMGARFNPEAVEAHIELAMVQQARFAETRLLTRIANLSTKVTLGKKFGVARDTFRGIEQAVAGYRSRNRLEETRLTAIFPTWFKEALRADLIAQAPGDGLDTFALAESTIAKWFDARNINVVWTLDGEAGQVFGTQTEGALLDFPTTVIWYLFAEGTFVFLDGGKLDLGIVRDSSLNSTNDYQLFVETFEGVAKFGNEALRITSDLVIAGSHALGVDAFATA